MNIKRLAALLLAFIMILPIVPIRVLAANEENTVKEVKTTIPFTKKTGDSNKFKYSETGWSAFGQSSEHVWSDARPSNPADVWYEVEFVGHKIDIYAGKNRPMGTVKYYIDGKEKGDFNLYNDYNINKTLITTFDNLGDGKHTLKAVSNGDGAQKGVIDCSDVVVYHKPYEATSFEILPTEATLIEGQKQKINLLYSPDYAETSDVKFSSENAEIATVNENGEITALKKGSTNIIVKSEKLNITKKFPLTVNQQEKQLVATIVDINKTNSEERRDEYLANQNKKASLKAWKNDKTQSEIALVAKNSSINNITVEASDFSDGSNTLAKSNVKFSFIDSTKAYSGPFLGWGDHMKRQIPADNGSNRAIVHDIVTNKSTANLNFNELKMLLMEVSVPKDQAAGTYTGKITVKAEGVYDIVFDYTIKVYDAQLPDVADFSKRFDIEMWQYPYSVAEYYGFTDEQLFGEEHLKVLRSSMEIYRDMGGYAITASIVDDAWNKQTYSKKDVGYPSMIKWIKQADGTFRYDYTHFDKWVEFNKKLGIAKKIVLYSIAPWGRTDGNPAHSIRYYDEASQTYKYQAYDIKFQDEASKNLWRDFLSKLYAHLVEKDWFDITYMGIDERGFSNEVFDFLASVKNSKGKAIKTAGAMDAFIEKKALSFRVDDLNVGANAISQHPNEYKALKAERDAKGLKTTAYSCTGHVPAMFSMSMPGESYWSIMEMVGFGADGFLRWAYDAYVEDPLRDISHQSFEAGDVMFVYPSEKNSETKEAQRSLRLVKIAEGIRDANKIKLMREKYPEKLGPFIDEMFNSMKISTRKNSSISSNPQFLTDDEKNLVLKDLEMFSEKIYEITDKFIKLEKGEEIEEFNPDSTYSRYDFEKIADNKIFDTNNDKKGTVSGGTLVDGLIGKSLRLEKGQEMILDDYQLGDSWTVSYWLYNENDSKSERVSVLSTKDKSKSFDMNVDPKNQKIGVRVAEGNGGWLTYANNEYNNKWTHFTWTKDEKAGLSLYINGKLNQTNRWTIGKNFPAPIHRLGGINFKGMVDELKIYDRVISNAEIVENAKLPGLFIENSKIDVVEGKTAQIEYTLNSKNADKTVKFVSKNPEIASVDENGLVTAKKKGETVITLTNEAGNYTAEVQVEVGYSYRYSIPQYRLDDKYITEIDKDETNARGRRYLGQPDMVKTNTGRLITAYPVGHGHGPVVMKYSDDKGKTWTELTNTPESWKGSQETPTLYTVNVKGRERIIMINANPGWGTNSQDSAGHSSGFNTSYSDDNGNTWTEYKNHHETLDGKKNYVIVAMASLIQLKDESGNKIDKWMGVYHNYDYVNYKTYLTFDDEGNEVWSKPEPYLADKRAIEQERQICEVGMFRSPDGNRIVALGRSQSHKHRAVMFYSDDEGKTWSDIHDLPAALQGERHKIIYDPISNKLLVTFREITLDHDNDGVVGNGDFRAGEWIMWVGTYDDLMNGREGEYRIMLKEDFAQNRFSGDTGYAGLVAYEDGTIVTNSYGHFDEEFSKTHKDTLNVKNDLAYIVQAKFKLADIEKTENTTPKGVNIALNKTAVSSSNEVPSLSANKITDGDTTTKNSRWSSAVGNGPHWVYIDLGKEESFDLINLYWETRKARNYEIQVLGENGNPQNNDEWKTIKSFNRQPENLRESIKLDEIQKARYIRLNIKQFNQHDEDTGITWNTISLYEIEVFNGMPAKSIDDIADSIKIDEASLSTNKLKFTSAESDRYTVKYNGTDYEQIIDDNQTIYQPLVAKRVKASFRIEDKKSSAYRLIEKEVLVPGKYTVEENDNKAPNVLPEISEWKGKEGTFTPTDNSRIVIANESLKGIAEEFKKDYKELFNKELEIVVSTESKVGDFVFTLTEDKNLGLKEEGYIFEITDKVNVKANTNTGLYWSTRTILQSLKANNNIPQGIGRDYPLYKVRGFMLDVGRKTFTLDYLKNIVKEMAWYKMNDLHVHLNDNFIFLERKEEPMKAYSGFRLESDIVKGGNNGLNKADLTSKDVFYTKDEFRALIKDSKKIGVNIVPEIDVPAHSLALTKVRPDLRTGTAGRENDHLNLRDKYDESVSFVKSIFGEYMNGENPVFTKDTVVHIGADEYEADKEAYRRFSKEMLEYVKQSGRKPRIWGSFTRLTGNTKIDGKGAEINLWSADWADMRQMYELGFDLINTSDSLYYIVPNAGYYYDYLNPATVYNNPVNRIRNYQIPAGDKQMIGSTFAVWNDMIDMYDNGVSEYDVYRRVKDAFPLFGAKLWGKQGLTLEKAQERAGQLGMAPGADFEYSIASKTNEIFNHVMDNKTDSSSNKYDIAELKNAEIKEFEKDKVLRLNGKESYAKTNLKTAGLGNSLRFKIYRDNSSTDEQVIFESPYGQIKAVQKGTGKLGISRENYDYSFDYTLPIKEWVEIRIDNKFEKTDLYVNGKFVQTIGHHTRINGRPLLATNMLPVEYIGSKTNSFVGYVDDVRLGKTEDFSSTVELKQLVYIAKSFNNEQLNALVKEAEDIIKAYNSTKESVKDITDRINNLINSMEYEKADYSELQKYIDLISDKLDMYTDDSAKLVKNVLDGINRKLPKNAQDIVNNYVDNLKYAISQLVPKPYPETEMYDPSVFTAKASSEEPYSPNGDSSAKAVLEYDKANHWHSSWSRGVAQPPHWIEITRKDGQAFNLSGLKYVPRNGGGNGNLQDYIIQISEDGKNFTDIKSGSVKVNADAKDINFDTVKTKHVRLVFKKSVGNFASASQIKLYKPIEDANYESLQSLLDKIDKIKLSDFEKESQAKLLEDVEKAKAVIKSQDSNYQAVEQLKSDLLEDIKNLVVVKSEKPQPSPNPQPKPNPEKPEKGTKVEVTLYAKESAKLLSNKNGGDVLGKVKKGEDITGIIDGDYLMVEIKGNKSYIPLAKLQKEAIIKSGYAKFTQNIRDSKGKIVGVEPLNKYIIGRLVGDKVFIGFNKDRTVWSVNLVNKPVKASGYTKFDMWLRDENGRKLKVVPAGLYYEGIPSGSRLRIKYNGVFGYIYIQNLQKERPIVEGYSKFAQYIRNEKEEIVGILPKGAKVKGVLKGSRVHIQYRGVVGKVWKVNLK